MSGEHFCFTSPDDPEPLECEQCAVFAERADYWRDAAEKRDAWLDAEMDRRRAAEAEVERLRERNAEWERKASAWMASPEAAQRLDGYRELAQRLNAAEGGEMSDTKNITGRMRAAFVATPVGDDRWQAVLDVLHANGYRRCAEGQRSTQSARGES